MQLLELIFPFSFNTRNIQSLIIKLVIYIVAGSLIGAIGSFVALLLKLAGLIFITGLIELYVFLGVVLTVLNFLDII